MKTTARSGFPVDNASILFLSRAYPYHTNSFRFTMTLHDPVDPALLQAAVDRIWKRFPSVIAGFQPGVFCYRQVPAPAAPQVQPDPGCLFTITREELHTNCFRVYYAGNDVVIEAFHALTDGYGTITTFTTLISEYLQLKDGICVPVSQTRLDISEAPGAWETADSFLDYADAPPKHLPSRFSYQLPRTADCDWRVKVNSLTVDVQDALAAAHRFDVSLNTLITTVLARSVMELQEKNEKKLKPVRIMVPADLRRLFPSKTLRNFSLYSLPAMEVSHRALSFPELCRSFSDQLKDQLSKETLGGMIAYNVKTQNAWYFRMIPWRVKSAAMRLGYRFFGESNSSLTLTNLGNVRLPEALAPHVKDFNVCLTPRTGSPYGCAVLTYNGKLTLNLSRFCEKTELDEIFFRNLQAVIHE